MSRERFIYKRRFRRYWIEARFRWRLMKRQRLFFRLQRISTKDWQYFVRVERIAMREAVLGYLESGRGIKVPFERSILWRYKP